MNNSEKPIYPMSASFSGADNELKLEYQNDNFSQQMGGLTKREHFAGLAMQALVSATDPRSDKINSMAVLIPKMAIQLADELLKQLEL